MKYLILLFLAIFALSSVNASSSECAICEYVASFVQNELKQNATIADIENDAEKLCSILGSFDESCEQLISGYLPEILKLIQENDSPVRICSLTSFCSGSSASSSSSSSSNDQVEIVEKKEGLKDIQCDLCTLIVSEIEKLGVNNHTETEIVDHLEDVCSKLGALANACDNIVQTYVPDIIQMLLNDQSPSTVCSEVHLCSSTTIVKPQRRNHFRKN